MTCYHPNRAYKSLKRAQGKYTILIGGEQPKQGFCLTWLPCGRCIGCRLKYSRTWASRIMQEAQLHPENTFITLTYNDENLPQNGFLVKKDFQDFMKRLRYRNPHKKIRYFMCGEYGDQILRPHYHACIFNHEFADQQHFSTNKQGKKLFTSDTLNSIWKMGYCITGALEFDSAAYVARYVIKKVNGKQKFDHYAHHTDLDTGEIVMRPQEYATMSRNKGIAAEWFKKYKTDVYPHDFHINNGHKMKPPRFFDEALKIEDPELYEKIKAIREQQLDPYDPELRPKRLKAKEEFKQQQIKRLSRGENYET